MHIQIEGNENLVPRFSLLSFQIFFFFLVFFLPLNACFRLILDPQEVTSPPTPLTSCWSSRCYWWSIPCFSSFPYILHLPLVSSSCHRYLIPRLMSLKEMPTHAVLLSHASSLQTRLYYCFSYILFLTVLLMMPQKTSRAYITCKCKEVTAMNPV